MAPQQQSQSSSRLWATSQPQIARIERTKNQIYLRLPVLRAKFHLAADAAAENKCSSPSLLEHPFSCSPGVADKRPTFTLRSPASQPASDLLVSIGSGIQIDQLSRLRRRRRRNIMQITLPPL